MIDGKTQQREKTIFVTVGTTSFDELITSISTEECFKVLEEKGYNKLVLQVGRGSVTPKHQTSRFEVEYYRYKPSLEEDIISADVVVSHAGAGCILESLRCKKKLLVVVNENLMGNHQIELAKKLHDNQYLHYCTCSNLIETLRKVDFSKLKEFPPSESERFGQFLGQELGLSSN